MPALPRIQVKNFAKVALLRPTAATLKSDNQLCESTCITCIIFGQTTFTTENMLANLRSLLTTRYAGSVNAMRLLAPYSTEVGKPASSDTALPAAASIAAVADTAPAAEKDRLYSSLEIELRGVDPAVLKSYNWFATTAASHLGIEVGKCWAERKAHHDRLTLLKSVHIYKKHRVQYEVRTYFRYMNFHKLTGSTLDTFLEYIERNLPEGVALNATKTEIQEMPEHLQQPPSEV